MLQSIPSMLVKNIQNHITRGLWELFPERIKKA
jgi:hypothetical protein